MATPKGFRIEHVVGQGRIMRASRRYEPGDTVLREPPCLTWPHDDAEQLISSFMCASADVQAAVLDMAAPDADAGLSCIVSDHARMEAVAERAARSAERSSLAARMAEAYDGPRAADLFEHLLLIGDINAHAFGKRAGLFPIAAKANHSCSPNCGHSTRVGGEMHYFATCTIEAGDEIVISYLDQLWSTTREERRRVLLTQKLFYCTCPRCSRADSGGGGRPPLEEIEPDSRGGERTAPQQLARAECAAAGCAEECATLGLCSPHAPCADLVGKAVTAFLACRAEAAEATKRGLPIASATTTALSAQISGRYCRWAVLQFGAEDRAVALMLRSRCNSCAPELGRVVTPDTDGGSETERKRA